MLVGHSELQVTSVSAVALDRRLVKRVVVGKAHRYGLLAEIAVEENVNFQVYQSSLDVAGEQEEIDE